MLALGLDTSCYTTSAALAGEGAEPVQARQLLPVSAGERGLRQSEAVFAHIRQVSAQVEAVMKAVPGPISCVCASAAPTAAEDSYMPVFRVGLAVGQSIAAALHVPFFETSHQQGHIMAAKYGTGLTAERFIALHLSGGTTDVLLWDHGELTPLGASLDLHAGQLVDRIGVALHLPFPCGPHLEALAQKGVCREKIPVSLEKDGLHCHLSGAENALTRMIAAGEAPEDVAAEVYGVLCRTVLRLLQGAAEQTGCREALLAGGVASSVLLREMLTERNEKRRAGLKLYFGRPEFSGDNAVGVALIGLEKLKRGEAESRAAAGR